MQEGLFFIYVYSGLRDTFPVCQIRSSFCKPRIPKGPKHNGCGLMPVNPTALRKAWQARSTLTYCFSLHYA